MTYVLVDEFEVKAARNRGNKPNPHGGELTKWYVDLLDSSGQPVKNEAGQVADAYWQRKAGSEVTAGDKVYGKVEEGEHGLRFKLEQRPDSGGSSYSGGSSESKATSGKSETDWNLRNAEIRRQHSQEMALRYAALTGDASLKLGTIADYADYFDDDAIAAGQKASQGAATAKGAANPPSPPDIAAPRPEKPSAVIDVGEIEQALDTAGLSNTGARSSVAIWMATELPEERVLKAIRNLTDPGAGLQDKTLEALKSNTEKHLGSKLPSGEEFEGDSDIPFRRPEYRPLFTERERWRF